MINRVVLVGRLARDPELRNTNTGKPVCSFTLAVDSRMKAEDGKNTAYFIPCVVFSQQAENVQQYIKKGSLVGIEGRLSQRSYERKDGTKANAFEVICDSVQFLEPKGDRTTQSTTLTPTFDDTRGSEDSQVDSVDLNDDDLPF